MSASVDFRLSVNPRRDGVEITLISPDGEVQTLALVQQPASLPPLMAQLGALLALELVNAVWEVRAGM